MKNFMKKKNKKDNLKITSSWPSYSREEISSTLEILKSNKVNYWTGIEGKEFEKEFSNLCKTKYAIAVSNGSVALDIAVKALGIREGDEVIVTPRSYIASVSCVVNSGATPVFADVDVNSQNITAQSIEKKISKKTKAIICVHLSGWPCDMDPIIKLSKQKNIKIIEDCSQAHGASYKGKPVGSLGDIGTFSFCNDKIISTGGEGGMITTNKRKYWKICWEYKDHGRDWNKINSKKINQKNSFKWIISSFGTNNRLTEIQSKIGRIQLNKLESWVKKRRDIAQKIEEVAYSKECIRKINTPNNIYHSYYRYYLFIDKNKLNKGWNRDRIINEIISNGIPCFFGSCPEIYLEKAFKENKKIIKKRLPNAKELGETSIAFLVHPTMTKNEVKNTCNVLNKILTKASRA